MFGTLVGIKTVEATTAGRIHTPALISLYTFFYLLTIPSIIVFLITDFLPCCVYSLKGINQVLFSFYKTVHNLENKLCGTALSLEGIKHLSY